MLKLLGKSASINVRKVLWLCTELGLTHEQEEWGTGYRTTQDAGFLSLNLNAMVPVLIDDGFVLWESDTICRYLASREQRHDLLPVAAGACQWMDWQATEFNNSWRYAFMGIVRRSPERQDAGACAAGVASWSRHMAIAEAQLERTGAYVVGAGFTLADVVIGLAVQRWFTVPLETVAPRPVLPAATAYRERLLTRPGFRRQGANGEP